MRQLIERVQQASVLDAPGKAIGKLVRDTVSPGPVKDALSGTWLGHALHPVLTDVVIGSFVSATILDLVGGEDSAGASERLIAVGIAAYPPTAATGVNDWADTEIADDRVRRLGLVHAASGATALALYSASLSARRHGSRGRGITLGLGGAVALLVASYIGGDLTLAKGVGPNQTAFDPGPEDWTDAGDPSELAEGRATRVVVDDTPVMLVQSGSRVYAVHDRCSHRGCSLSDGEIEGDSVVCACHGSRFGLGDGALRHGPATVPQPAFEVRRREGRLEIRRAR